MNIGVNESKAWTSLTHFFLKENLGDIVASNNCTWTAVAAK